MRRHCIENPFFLFAFLSVKTLLFSVTSYSPQEIDPLLESWRWRHYEMFDGKGILKMIEADDGALWFSGIENNRRHVIQYNGLDTTQYWIGDIALVATRASSVLSELESGHIYDNLDQNLFLIHADEIRKAYPFLQRFTFRCFQSSDKTIWLGVSGGLFRIDDQITFYAHPDVNLSNLESYPQIKVITFPQAIARELVDGVIFDIAEGSDNHLYLAFSNANSIVRFQPDHPHPEKSGAWRVYNSSDGLVVGSLTNMLWSQDNRLWVVNESVRYGIHILDPGTDQWSSFKLSDQFGGSDYNAAILQTRDGTIWIGGMSKIFAYKNNHWRVYQAPDVPVPQAEIRLYETSDGALWIYGEFNQIWRVEYDTDRWKTFERLNYQCNTPDGDAWFIQYNGRIARAPDIHQPGGWLSYGVRDGLMDAPVRLYASDGELWAVGSHNRHAAYARFDGRRWHRKIHPELSWGIDHRAIYQSSMGDLWLGAAVDYHTLPQCQGGILKVNPDRSGFKHYHLGNSFVSLRQDVGFGNFSSYGIAEMRDGTIWISGIFPYYYQQGQWFDAADTLGARSDAVDNTYDKQLWVGTRGNGIWRHDGEFWTQFSTDDGLSSNTITDVLCASDGTVWAATDDDISRFDGRYWNTRRFPEALNIYKESGSLYEGVHQSLWINQAYRAWYRRAYPNSTYESNHPEHFFTVQYQPDTIPPVTRLTVTMQRVSLPGNTVISWEGTDPWETTGRNYLEYSYQLDDLEWTPYTSETNRIFLSLNSGKHRFQVRARDKDLNADPTPAVLDFRVDYPVYMQFWFIMLVLCFLGIGSYLLGMVIKRDKRLFRLNISLTQQKEALESANEEINAQKSDLEKAAHALLASNENLTEFAYVASHDLQEPLRKVVAFSDRLSAKYAEVIDSRGQDYIERIQNAAKRMQNLINGLLTYSRVTTKAQPFESVDLQEIVGDVLADLEIRIEQTGAKVELGALPCLHADPLQMRQLFQNMIGNALKFVRPDVPPEIHIYADPPDKKRSGIPYHHIHIKDNGVGFDAEYAERIFGVFQRLHTRDQYEGTGIGLSVCKKIVERHGGEIRAEGKPGKGAEFVISLKGD